MIMYFENSKAVVQNALEWSTIFMTTIGVKQGGVMSPDLYKLYSDDIIPEIEALNLGVVIGKQKISIVCYKYAAIYAALHRDSTVNSLIKNKLGLYQRLINNEFTCELQKQTMDVPKSITEEVIVS